jgi:hypothetical protein
LLPSAFVERMLQTLLVSLMILLPSAFVARMLQNPLS